MMAEFIRRTRYPGTAWQVCHAPHYFVISICICITNLDYYQKEVVFVGVTFVGLL